MAEFRIARMALVTAEGDRYAPYYQEALDHFGLLVSKEPVNWDRLFELDVLLLAGYGHLSLEQCDRIQAWVQNGGSLVVSGSTWGLHSLLGVEPESRKSHISTGEIAPIVEGHPTWPAGAERAKFHGGCAVKSLGSEVASTVGNEGVGVSGYRFGEGTTYFVAPHVGQTMAQIQLGYGVESDRVAPTDPLTRLDDGVLRAEDGVSLSFESDRQPVPDCDSSFFGVPHADIVREIWCRTILQAVEATGLRTVMLWPWPNGADGCVTLTIECDESEPESVATIYRQLQFIGGKATWLVSPPGFPHDAYKTIRSWGHDIGLLFDSEGETGWSDEKLKIQHVTIGRSAGSANLSCSRAVEGRWLGLRKFYDLIESAGIRMSVSKGGRQPGTTGFLFGTCHPFYPRKADGTAYKVGELPYLVYCPGEVSPNEAVIPIVEAVVRRNGCFHLAAPVSAAERQTTLASIRRAAALARQVGLEFMTVEGVWNMERVRRTLRIRDAHGDGRIALKLSSDYTADGFTILISGGGFEAGIQSKKGSLTPIERYGVAFQSLSFDLESKTQTEIVLRDQTVVAQTV